MKCKMTGIILAGGKNDRMGLNKALLKIGGATIIERLLDTINPMFTEIIVVTNYPDDFKFLDIRSVRDVVSTRGSLVGVYSGLINSDTHQNFFFACDMAFVKAGLVKFMTGQSPGYDVTIPRGQDGLEPLHAIYSKECIGPIENQIKQGNMKIVDFFPLVRVKVIEKGTVVRLDPECMGFFNVNTRADYETALRIGERHCVQPGQ